MMGALSRSVANGLKALLLMAIGLAACSPAPVPDPGASPAVKSAPDSAPSGLPEAALAPVSTQAPVVGLPDPSGNLRVVYFFADRCPNCPIMEPLLMDALARFDRQNVAYIPIDLDKALNRSEPDLVRASLERAAAVADAWGVGHVFDAYFQYTGLAVLTARDSGEVIACLARSLTSDEMEMMIEDARRRVRAYPPNGRTPDGGPDCPPPVG